VDRPQLSPLAGIAPGVATIAVLLLVLRVAGLPWLGAYAAAALTGAAVTVAWCRRHGGAHANPGLAVTLTLSYSMLAGVLDAFLLAVAGG
jgi:hypothetical protein